ncbi:MAG: hypothetical protein Tsb0016_02560 [Sphingomonadales bacterium]
MNAEKDLLSTPPAVINVGIGIFADALSAQNVPVAHVNWQPPVELEDDLKNILDNLL